MKKYKSLIIVLALVLSLTGCTASKSDKSYSGLPESIENAVTFKAEKTDEFDGLYGTFIKGITSNGSPWGVDYDGKICGTNIVLSEDADNSVLDSAYIDEDYSIIANDGNLLVYDNNGDYKGKIYITDGFIEDIVSGGYTLFSTGDHYKHSHVCWFDPDTLKAGKEIAGLNDDINGILESGSSDDELLFYNNTGVFSFSISDKKTSLVFNWLDINLGNVYLSWKGNDEKYYAACFENGSTVIYKITKEVPGEASEKKEVVIAVMGDDYSLSKAVKSYNDSHQDVMIVLRNYDISERDITDSEKNLQAELLTDDAPDVIYDFNMPFLPNNLAKQGYLEDLGKYIDCDPDISIDDFYPEVLNSFKYKGEIWQLSRSFTIKTLLFPAENIDENTEWTIKHFLDNIEEHPDAESRDYIWWDYIFMYYNLDYFVDETTGECYFESEDFKRLLKLIKEENTQEDRYSIDENDIDDETAKEYFKQGVRTFRYSNFLSLDELANNLSVIEQPLALGFPTRDGKGKSVLENGCGLSIVKTSDKKDEAWDFVKYWITHSPTIEETGFLNAFYSYKTITEKRIKKELELCGAEEELFEDTNGKVTLLIGTHNLTEDDVEIFYDCLDNSEPRSPLLPFLLNVFEEEIDSYLEDQKELDEVCCIIQSRVQLYMSENGK